MSSVNARNKQRTVVVQQSPVTTEERRKHLLAASENERLRAENDRLAYALDASGQDYMDLEQNAYSKIEAIRKSASRKMYWLFVAGLLIGYAVSYLPHYGA